MATNKRKDAAALFELIDKSTLKVPKNAGSLKIPRWWSSQSGAADAAPEPAKPAKAVAREAGTAASDVASKAPEAVPGDASAGARDPEAAAAQAEKNEPAEPAVQHRLFDPPPAHVMPEMSPSIRIICCPPFSICTMLAASLQDR